MVVVLLAAAPQRAMADEWLDAANLRGSFAAPPVRWDGINFGGHIGYTNMNADYSKAAEPAIGAMLHNTTVEVEDHVSTWALMGKNATNSAAYGAFLGYTTQWDEVVIGFDLAYNRLNSMQSSSSGAESWVIRTDNGYDNYYSVSGSASLKQQDYATARVRFGYAFGQFLPYLAIGGAVGRFDYFRTVTVSLRGVDTSVPPGASYNFGTHTQTDQKNGAIVGGFTVALGMDVAIAPNMFLRGEWEFVGYGKVAGITAGTNTARVGLGVRF